MTQVQLFTTVVGVLSMCAMWRAAWIVAWPESVSAKEHSRAKWMCMGNFAMVAWAIHILFNYR